MFERGKSSEGGGSQWRGYVVIGVVAVLGFGVLQTIISSETVSEQPEAAPSQIAVSKQNVASDHAVSTEVEEPRDYRMDNYRAPVPATLKGAKVIEAEEAVKLFADQSAIFIDVYPRAPKPPNLPKNTVWRDPIHMSIKGAYWLPNVGYGVVSPQTETYFKTQLKRLSEGEKSKALVFFCLKDCWMSWNAAKRALTYGYSNVIWFPDGTDGWQEAGENLSAIKAVKDKPSAQ